MAINWPSYAIGTNIGKLYTSSNGDVWRWNGNAWDISNLQSSGSYKGPWIIFRDPRNPNYYSNLTLALAGATSGETIYLATDVSEIFGSQLTVTSNINLNGNTFKFIGVPEYPSSSYIIIGDSINNTNIQNGNIIFVGSAQNVSGITSLNDYNSHDLTGLTVTISSFTGGLFRGSLNGGTFYNNSTAPTSCGVQFRTNINNLYYNQTISTHIKNVKGVSSGGFGISIIPDIA
jgi:hypothetical protein